MNATDLMVTVLAFFLTLGVLIVVHEYGHYRVAVACGVRVLRFSIGFGRVLWRRQPKPDGTEFVVCALPFGGYVRMLDEREGDVPVAELGRAFNRKPLWQRALIVAAGPIANLLLAIALYAAAHWIGVDEPKALLGPPVAASVAERAGMRAGDWVRAWSSDGAEWRDVRSLTDLRWQVTQSMLHGDDIDLLVSSRDGRGQRRVHLELAPLAAGDVDAKTMQKIGLGNPVERAGARRRQGGRRRCRGRPQVGRPDRHRSTASPSTTRRRRARRSAPAARPASPCRCAGASNARACVRSSSSRRRS